MDTVIPAGTKCDADCIAWAQTRITVLSVMLPVFLCGHHEHEFAKAMKKKPTLEFKAEYNTVNV